MKTCGLCKEGDELGKKFTGKTKIRRWLGVAHLCLDCEDKIRERYDLKNKGGTSIGGAMKSIGALNRIKNYRTQEN